MTRRLRGGLPAQEVAGRIEREKINALGPATHAGPGRGITKTVRDTNGFSASSDGADYIVARLRRDAEDGDETAAGLYGKVLAGEVTPNAATREPDPGAPRRARSARARGTARPWP